jgi:3-isopropylmalate/(R)-2-methylmalate dehydratase small subunit
MTPCTIVSGRAAPLLKDDISTDLIAPVFIPGRTAQEFADLPMRARLFANLRYQPSGMPDPSFVLNDPRFAGCNILLAGANFGCGSSRETAVWALMDHGIRCVLAAGFGEIFFENALQNGLLPLVVPPDRLRDLAAAQMASATAQVTVDLAATVIRCPGLPEIGFTLSDDRRLPLLAGLDQLQFMLSSADQIAAFEAADQAARPWIYAAVAGALHGESVQFDASGPHGAVACPLGGCPPPATR